MERIRVEESFKKRKKSKTENTKTQKIVEKETTAILR